MIFIAAALSRSNRGAAAGPQAGAAPMAPPHGVAVIQAANQLAEVLDARSQVYHPTSRCHLDRALSAQAALPAHDSIVLSCCECRGGHARSKCPCSVMKHR